MVAFMIMLVPVLMTVFMVFAVAGPATAGVDCARSICGQVMFVFMIVRAFFGVLMYFAGRMRVARDLAIFRPIFVMLFVNWQGFCQVLLQIGPRLFLGQFAAGSLVGAHFPAIPADIKVL